MTPQAAERLRVYQEGRKSSTDDNAVCPYTASNWRFGTWNKGRKAALEYWSEVAEIESRIAFLDQPVVEPKREWVGLSAKDMETFEKNHGYEGLCAARTAEALLRGKNNG